MWTSQSAMDLHVPVPNIDVAVSMRNLSALEEQREAVRAVLAGAGLAGGAPNPSRAQPTMPVERVRGALYAAMIVAYCQGFAATCPRLADLRVRPGLGRGRVYLAGRVHHKVDPTAAHKRCVRASARAGEPAADGGLAGGSREARRPGRSRLRLPSPPDTRPGHGHGAWLRGRLCGSVVAGEPDPAQRDLFGAHTYRRVDREGVFHTEWAEENS